MARKKKIEACSLNIRLHPHNEQLYLGLLTNAYKMKKAIQARGDQYLFLSHLGAPKDIDGVTQVRGTIARFTYIDKNQPWFNIETSDEAEEDDVNEIVIPEHLRANFKPFNFLFFPQKHRLIVDLSSDRTNISPKVIESFFLRLLNYSEITKVYGKVNITVTSNSQDLDRILGMSVLRTLDIIVERPNPDDHEEEEREFLDRMNAQNVNRLEQKLTAIHGQSIEPNHDTKMLARIALENGKLSARGKENGKPVTYKSIEHPRVESLLFDPDELSETDAFRILAKRYLGRI